MQFGVGASLLEASPRHIEDAPVMQAYDQDEHGPGEERFEKMRQEKERHEREMKRRPHESDQEHRERQRQENERHERDLRDIQER